MHRIGHVVHRCRDIVRLDVAVVDDIPTTSATRTIIDLAAVEPPSRLATAIDSALRDRLTTEDSSNEADTQMQNDAERVNRMILDGLLPLQFTYVDLVTESPMMFSAIREALGAATPQPKPVS